MASPPRTIGPYQVLRKLGSGGMGSVFEVRHPELPRPQALKLIRELTADEEGLARFQREAQLLASVHHRNVLRISQVGQAREGPYIVTDLVEGEDLGDVVARGSFEPRASVELVAELAEAIASLHARGILHRDLKPSNVILRPDGVPILVDFGLARSVDVDRLTRTGEFLGTPAYVAPEQAVGRCDERSDVYGLGGILYFLLTGRPPFEGKSAVDVLRAVFQEDPTWPDQRDPDLPPGPCAVCRVALAKRPEDRYASARALAEDLRRWLAGAPPKALERFPGLARRSRAGRLGLPAWALGAVAVAILAGGAVAALRLGGPETPGGAKASSPGTPAPSEATPAEAPSRDLPPGAPLWLGELPPAARPPLPLPSGLAADAERPGLYRWEQDGSTLVWSRSAGIFFGRHEVTWAQLDAFREAPAGRDLLPFLRGEPRQPAHSLTRAEAERYCAWAGLRLPTRSEWELAATGASRAPFPWGRTFDPALANGPGQADGFRQWAEVGSFPKDASPDGAVDVAGNVAEWVAPDPGDSPTSSICRGGAWRLTKAQEGEGIPPSVALDLGRSWEWQRQPTRERRASNAIGFRVALDPRPE